METTAIAAAAIAFVASADPVQAQSIVNVGFEDGTLSGWTAGGGTGTQAPDNYDGNGVGVSVVSGMEDFTSGGSTYQWTVTPYGDYMASLQAVNSGNTFATGSTELGLTSASQAEITSTLGASATTASWIYQDLTLNAGDSFTMAWQYVSTDYDPFNDASYTSLVNIDDNSILATVNNLASQYALLGATVPGTGNYSTGSYGATGWQLSTYSVDTAGTYRLGFMSLNLKDTALSPVFFVDQAPGATFNFDDPFGPIAPNEGSEAPTTPPPPPTGPTTTDISGTVNASDIADSGAFLGGTLLIDLASMTLAQGFTINGSGATIDTNGNQSTFTGTISDETSGTPGSLTISGSGGTVTLTGTNVYTGATTIGAGTTLALTGTGSIAGSSEVIVDGTFNISGTDAGAQIEDLSGGGSIQLGGQSLTITDAENSFDGTIGGTGGLIQAGGSLVLNGANTFTGGFTLAGGTLGIGNSSALGTGTLDAAGGTTIAYGDGVIAANAVIIQGPVDFSQDGGSATHSGNISGSGGLTKTGSGNLLLTGSNSYTGGTTIVGGTLTGSTTSLTGDVLNNAALVIDQDTDGTFAGDVSGTGSLTKDGDGNVTLTGANSYTGGTTIAGGTLTGSTTSLTGDVLNNAALVIDQDADGTFAGDVSGSGSLTKDGDGNVTLTGANTYTGGTAIAGGTLTGSTTSLTGDVLNNAALVIDQDANGTFAGDVSGSGSLTKDGDGNVTLTGANTYTGGTAILGGTLTGSTISLTGDVLNNAALVIDQDTDGAFAGDVSGSGSLTKDGDGNVTLTGANSYTGGTAILGGTLTASTTSLGGYVLNNADLVIDEDADADFAGMLAGTGNVEKTGSGIVTLSGMHTLSGETTISQGSLNVVGDYSASAITVASGALLTGNGIVSDVSVGDGATLAPNGMLVADGDVTLAMGSTLLVNADADGNADMLGVTGALEIQGGTVSVLAADGSYDWQTAYAIVAADTVSGTFDAVVTDLAFLDPSLVYSANGVALVLTRNDLAFADVAVTANQRAAGQAFDASFDPTTDAYYAFASLNGTMARETLDALSGEAHATVANTAWQDSARIRRAVLERLDLPRGQGANLWLQIEAGRDDWNGNASAAGYLRETMSYIGGLEYGTGKSKLGIAIGHTDGDMQLASRASSVSVKGTHGHAYAGSDFGALRLAVGASYADLDVETDRNVAFGAIDQDLSADYGAKVYGAYARAGVLLPIGKGAIEPFAGITWNRFDRDGFAETGGSLALDAADEKADWTFSSLGLKGHVSLDAQDKVAFRFLTEWQRALDGRATTATMAFGNGPDFTVNGAPLAKHAGLVDVGVHWKLSPDVGFAVSYGGTVARQGFSQNGRATLSLRF